MLGFINCNHIFHYGCVPKVNNIIVCEICLNINSYKSNYIIYLLK